MKLLTVVAALLAWALFFGGGSDTGRLAWIGGAAVLALAACAALLPPPRLSRTAWAFFALLGAFAVWTGLSLLWSWAPDRAWDAFNRDLVYLAFAGLGVYAARAGLHTIATALASLVASVAVWALGVHVFADDERVDRLHDPVGYWNVLAFVLALGLPLALWLAQRRRLAGTLFAYALAVVLLLTYSRGGVMAAVVAVAVWLLIARPPLLETGAVFVSAVVPAALVFAQELDGADFAIVFVLGGTAAIALVRFVPPRLHVAVGGVAAATAAIAFVVTVGNPVAWAGDKIDDFTNPPQVQRPQDELLTATSSNRWTWWGEAWQAFEDEPVAGTGAGSFELVHRQLRQNDLHARDPHNLPLAVLSETGLVGLALFAAAVVCAVLGTRPIRDASSAALAAGAVAYLAHALVDRHWQYVAATAPVAFIVGVLLASNSLLLARGRRSGLSLAAPPLAALALLYSLAAPQLANRRVEEAREQIAARDYDRAARAADSARSLNPLALEPLLAGALAEDLRGNDSAALELYLNGVELQPRNWRAWYELGVFEFLSLRRLDDAFLDLDKAYQLDPRNTAVTSALDRVRDTLEGRTS